MRAESSSHDKSASSKDKEKESEIPITTPNKIKLVVKIGGC